MKSTTILMIATIHIGYLLTNLNNVKALPVVNKAPAAKPTDKVKDKVKNKVAYLETEPSSTTYNSHVHKIEFKGTELRKLNKAFCDGDTSKYLKVKETKEEFYHFHMVTLCRVSKNGHQYKIVQCDGKGKCWDGHDSKLKTFYKAT